MTLTAKHAKVDATMAAQEGVAQVSSSTRVQELRAEMSEHFENRLAQANRKIGQPQEMIEKVQANQCQAAQRIQVELNQLKEEQSFTRQKIQDVESSVVSSSKSMIQIMQTMMAQMQTNLEASMKRMMQPDCSDDMKRPRVGDEGKKQDAF